MAGMADSREFTQQSRTKHAAMKGFLTGFLAIFSCLCLMMAAERRAYAYIDPGSGFTALQSIAAVMAATSYFLRRRIKALFTRKKTNKPTMG
jgi:hypothetical protein